MAGQSLLGIWGITSFLIHFFLLFSQLLAFPYIVKWLGYRKAFQIGLIVFFVASIIIPFTNQITGPIDGTVEDQAQNTSLSSCSAHHDLNDTFLLGENMTSNGTDFCGNDLEDTIRVNDNSIKRIPFVVWLTLMMVMILSVVSK